jgi:hypothetical protein
VAGCDPFFYSSNQCQNNSITSPSFSPTQGYHVSVSLLSVTLIILLGLLVCIGAALIVNVCLRFKQYKYLTARKQVVFEVTPPLLAAQSDAANEALYTVMHGLLAIRSARDWFVLRKRFVSLELVATKKAGFRYVLAVPSDYAEAIKRQLIAYLPAIKIREISDYVTQSQLKNARVSRYHLAGPLTQPLAEKTDYEQYDPIAYLSGVMSRLKKQDLVGLQLVITPTLRRTALLPSWNQAAQYDDGQPSVLLWTLPVRFIFKVFVWSLKLMGSLMLLTVRFCLDGPGWAFLARKDRATYVPRSDSKPLSQKDRQPLFLVEMRTIICSSDLRAQKAYSEGIAAALSLFHVPNFQGLRMSRSVPFAWYQRLLLDAFRLRLPTLPPSRTCVLNAGEIAGLYHFAYGKHSMGEDLNISFTKTLPMPLELKDRADSRSYDVVLGNNSHHGKETVIGLSAAERHRHVYIVGGSGNGKTTMLEYAMLQDIRAGKGLAFIDPHGDSARKLLEYIPKKRMQDVIYFDPSDYDHPIGINLLEVPKGLTGSELKHAQDMVTEAVISVFSKLYDDNPDINAYRIERVLRNAIQTAFTIENATLFTVLRLLTDPSYTRSVVRGLQDERLQLFWKQELGNAGMMQLIKMLNGATSRLDRFASTESAKRVLQQPHSTISFDEIMNGHKILICNLSKGNLGEDTSTLFGKILLAQLQLAAWRREAILPQRRRAFYLYVDEFQLFASRSFMGLFSEARKYKLYLTMAQQSMAQLDGYQTINTILDNVGTIVCFRSKSPATEQLMLHQFSPYVQSGEIGNLPSYHFYLKIAALDPQAPVSGITIRLSGKPSVATRNRVIEASRAQYASVATAEANTTLTRTVAVKPAGRRKLTKLTP